MYLDIALEPWSYQLPSASENDVLSHMTLMHQLSAHSLHVYLKGILWFIVHWTSCIPVFNPNRPSSYTIETEGLSDHDPLWLGIVSTVIITVAFFLDSSDFSCNSTRILWLKQTCIWTCEGPSTRSVQYWNACLVHAYPESYKCSSITVYSKSKFR